jgi:hypothetical protein
MALFNSSSEESDEMLLKEFCTELAAAELALFCAVVYVELSVEISINLPHYLLKLLAVSSMESEVVMALEFSS